MDILGKTINAVNYFFSTIGKFVTVAIILGGILLASVFTPVFSKGILFVLHQLALPKNAISETPTTAIVVLGGGLTNDKHNDIILNKSSLMRLEKTVNVYQETRLPVIVSGREAPWMMQWLLSKDVAWVIPEKESYNTCENARFTALTVPLTHVILVTDPYHMNRARRQFALSGIATTPMPSDFIEQPSWQNPNVNIKHSRRATYELVAFARDIFRPQSNCRQKPPEK